MKSLLIGLLLVAGLSNCKKKESEAIPTRALTADEQPLVGTWRATRFIRKNSGTANDSTFYKTNPPTITFQPTGFYQYSEGDWNNRNGFIWVTGQQLPGLFSYTPSQLTITLIEYYNYQQQRLTATYDLAWIGLNKRQFTLKLAGQGDILSMTFEK